MSSKTTFSASDQITAHSTNDVEKRLREKLEASGEFGKMRAMIVDAALKTLYNKEEKDKSNNNYEANKNVNSVNNNVGQQTNDINSHATSPFSPSRTLLEMKDSEVGKVAFGLIVNMLEYCELPYTANVLRMEANLTKEIVDNGNQKEYYDKVLKSITRIENYSSEMPVLYSLVMSACDIENENKNNNNKITEEELNQESNEPVTKYGKEIVESKESLKQERPKNEEQHAMPQETTSTKHVAENELQVKSETTKTSSPQAPDAVDSTYFISKWHDKTFVRINAITGQQLQVEYLSNCTLYVLDAIDSMTIDDCDDCELIIAACEGSVFIRNCHRLTVHVACKQLRLRDCAECELHVFTSTDPVIEMSHHITFRPFHLRLPDLSAKFAAAHLIAEHNRFVHVYDFTEDVASLPQPHFTIRYPDHDVQIEDKCTEYGNVNCPDAIEQLLNGAILPAASSESGISKSYNIKTGAAKWQHVSSPTTNAADVVAADATSPSSSSPTTLPSNNIQGSKEYASLSNITTNSYELSDDDEEKRNNKIHEGIDKSKLEDNNNNKNVDVNNDEDVLEGNRTKSDMSSSDDDKSESSEEYDESENTEEKDDESEDDDDDDESTSYTDTDEDDDSEEEEKKEDLHSSKDNKDKDNKDHMDDNDTRDKFYDAQQKDVHHSSEQKDIDSIEEDSAASPLREVPSLHKTNTDAFATGGFANSVSAVDKSGKPPIAVTGTHSPSKTTIDSHLTNASTNAQKHNEVNHNKSDKNKTVDDDDEEYSSFDDDDDDDDDEDDHYNVDEDDDVF